MACPARPGSRSRTPTARTRGSLRSWPGGAANCLLLVKVSATIPGRWLGPILFAGTATGSAAIAAAGIDNSALVPLYLGGGPFVFAFFTLRHALAQVAFAALCYAGLLTASALQHGRPELLYGEELTTASCSWPRCSPSAASRGWWGTCMREQRGAAAAVVRGGADRHGDGRP